jgi:hypothetical protein
MLTSAMSTSALPSESLTENDLTEVDRRSAHNINPFFHANLACHPYW